MKINPISYLTFDPLPREFVKTIIYTRTSDKNGIEYNYELGALCIKFSLFNYFQYKYVWTIENKKTKKESDQTVENGFFFIFWTKIQLAEKIVALVIINV